MMMSYHSNTPGSHAVRQDPDNSYGAMSPELFFELEVCPAYRV